MTDWYKMAPLDWNEGTQDLSLEQEAAYLRICHAIYITERPVKVNWFVIAGLMRCNERRAKRLVSELTEAGKIAIEDGFISNRRAVDEVSTTRRLRVDRQSAGSRGGVESAKSRAKPLINNDRAQAIASHPVEPDKNRIEESIPPSPQSENRRKDPSPAFTAILNPMDARRLADHLGRISIPMADSVVSELRKVRDAGGNPSTAVDIVIKRGWRSIDLEWLRNAGLPLSRAPVAPQNVDWSPRIEAFRKDGTWVHAWGPKPGESGCRAPPELVERAA